MRVADIDQTRHGVAVKTTQRIAAPIMREGAFVESRIGVEFAGVEIDRRISRAGEHVGMGDVGQVRTLLVVTPHEGNRLAAIIGQAIVVHILAGIDDVVPIVVVSVIGEVVFKGEEEGEVQDIAVAAHRRRIGRVEVLGNEGLQLRLVAGIRF